MRADYAMQEKCGFAGGDVSLYRYVRNSPTNFTDPSGLQQLQKVQADPEGLGIKLDGAPKELGKVSGGVVSYSTGKQGKNSIFPGLYLQYEGPKAEEMFFIQFMTFKAYVVDEKGKKIKDIDDLPMFQEKKNDNLALKNGVKIGHKDGRLTWYVDGFHPAGVSGVADKSGNAGLGGITKKGVLWQFDAPEVPRAYAVARVDDNTPERLKLKKDQKLVIEMVFRTYLVIQERKNFKVLGRIDWSASCSVSWNVRKVGELVVEGWLASLSTVSMPTWTAGPGGDFEVFQKAYQNNLQLHENKEGYALVK